MKKLEKQRIELETLQFVRLVELRNITAQSKEYIDGQLFDLLFIPCSKKQILTQKIFGLN